MLHISIHVHIIIVRNALWYHHFHVHVVTMGDVWMYTCDAKIYKLRKSGESNNSMALRTLINNNNNSDNDSKVCSLSWPPSWDVMICNIVHSLISWDLYCNWIEMWHTQKRTGRIFIYMYSIWKIVGHFKLKLWTLFWAHDDLYNVYVLLTIFRLSKIGFSLLSFWLLWQLIC